MWTIYGAVIATCPKCLSSIGVEHPYEWCGCGEPIAPDVRSRLKLRDEPKVPPTTSSEPDVDESGQPMQVRCPFCSEQILSTARKCKHCGEWLQKAGSSKPSAEVNSVLSAAFGGGLGVLYWGLPLLLGGLGWVMFALNMDTSVPSGVLGLDRVNNLGLMSDKQNYLIAGGIVAVIGAVLTAVGTGRSRH